MEVIHLKYPYQLIKQQEEAYSMALGFFDGVHLGHQAVIQQAKQHAYDKDVKTAVMTFDPHPSIVLGGRSEQVFYITLMPEKLRLLEALGVDTVFVVQFTSDFARLSPAAFIDTFIRDMNVVHVTAGFDYSFGSKGAGTMAEMQQLSNNDYDVTIVDKQTIEEDKVSSTRIRRMLEAGDMEGAHALLGRPFAIDGIVIQGDKRGRQIGFPTANVQCAEGSFIPAIGVYAVRIKVQDAWYDGVCNVGYVPTFKDNNKHLTVEVHILNFDKNIYGEEVQVTWYKRIRSEQKFDGIEALITQIAKDKDATIQYFTNLV